MSQILSTYQAPWGTTLKVISLFSTLLMVAIATLGLSGLLSGHGDLEWGLSMIVLPLAIVLGAAPFMIRGYVLTTDHLTVKRLGWVPPIELRQLTSAEADPTAMAGSLKLFGNGGLFSVTGLFRNAKLGNYRAYATHLKRCVILRFKHRVIVVTPDHPEDLVHQLRMLMHR